jgi:DNA polymerase III subunit delta
VGKAKQVNWSQAASAGVTLVSGAEEFLASRVVRAIKLNLSAANPMLEVSELEGAEYEAGRLIELTTPSLFGEPRVVVVNGLERCTDALIEDGLAYLADPTDDCTVIFRHASGVRGKKLLDAIRGTDAAIEITCEKITKEADRIAFATGEFKTLKKQAANGAIRAIVAAFGDDVAGLAAACAQLSQDVAESVDEDTVQKYFGGHIEVNNFQLVDAALAGDASTTLSLLRQTLSAGAEPITLVSAVAHRMRTLAKLLNNRSATAAQLGMQAWMMDRARRELGGWTEDAMAAVIQEIAKVDAAAKGAERDSEFAIERLFLLILNKGARA